MATGYVILIRIGWEAVVHTAFCLWLWWRLRRTQQCLITMGPVADPVPTAPAWK